MSNTNLMYSVLSFTDAELDQLFQNYKGKLSKFRRSKALRNCLLNLSKSKEVEVKKYINDFLKCRVTKKQFMETMCGSRYFEDLLFYFLETQTPK